MRKDIDLIDFLIQLAKKADVEIIIKRRHKNCGDGILMLVNGVMYCGVCGYLGN